MMLPWWFAIVQNGFLRGNCKNSIAKHWAVKWGRRTEASLAEKGNATHVEHVWEHVWNAFHQTRVDNSSMWLLRLALAFGAMRPLRSSVATGNWEGDVTLPLAIAFGWLSIADKSGSRFLDDLELLSYCKFISMKYFEKQSPPPLFNLLFARRQCCAAWRIHWGRCPMWPLCWCWSPVLKETEVLCREWYLKLTKIQ